MTKDDDIILQTRQLALHRDLPILENINWSIHRGEHWVILGPNGCGKTSLLNTILAYKSPTSGSIAILDQHYGQSNWPKLRQRIGIVSSSLQPRIQADEKSIFLVLSGKEAMINYWGEPRGEDLAQAERILAAIESLHLADRSWSCLSQGERQRVLIGRALMAAPEILILDEACAGLDIVAREHFLKFLQRFAAQAHAPTLIFVTHHIEEIIPVFTHLLMLKKGRVLQQGTKTDLMTSQLISELFDAKIEVQKRGEFFTAQLVTSSEKIF